MCNRPPERVELYVVGKAPAAGDLDDRQPLSIGLLERRIARDVDLAEVEAELVAQSTHLLERALAEMTTCRVIDGDVDQSRSATDRCRG